MKFNPLERGKNREANTNQKFRQVMESSYMCTIAISQNGRPMMLPMAYGFKDNTIYLHGSLKNHLLNAALETDEVCICVYHNDGLVLAQTLYNTGLNYRSVVLFGKAYKITDEEERLKALKIITDQIIPGRWDEVETGTEAQINSTLMIKIPVESATVKIREGNPTGDEELNKEVWSGHIPLKEVSLPPVYDAKRLQFFDEDESVKMFYLKNKF